MAQKNMMLKRASPSARILVAVKHTVEIPGILELLFDRVVQSEDYVMFLHIAPAESSDPISLDEVVFEAVYSIRNLVSKVTISSLVLGSTGVCDAIVSEAQKMKATMILLGSSRIRVVTRSMHRIGKRCVKELPPYCSILIIQRGKVMQATKGSAVNHKRNTLKALLRRQRKLEQPENKAKMSDVSTCSEASSTSCSLDTLFSFSTDPTSGSTTDTGSPDTVLHYSQLQDEQNSSRKLGMSLSMDVNNIKRFEYEELLAATSEFSSDSLVGRGGCCSVYRGVLEDGSIVAVKRLLDSSSGEREFSREIRVVSYICHPNLVSLIGYCNEESHRLLVYEFLQNGSLQEHLHGTASGSLSWKRRQSIAAGAARGLEHLHRLSPHHVVHQDVKSSNILLTSDFQPRISDFGFARWSNELTMACSGLFGTFGYMAPEYLVHGIANEKSDVYSFGVVLLELISGRPSIDASLPTKQQSLVHWASLLRKAGATHQMVDPRLKKIDCHEMKRMMYTALLCIRSLPEERPSMEKVVRLLDAEMTCSEALLSGYS